MVGEGTGAGKSRKKMLPGGRERENEREPWAISIPHSPTPAVPSLHILWAIPLFLQWTHTHMLYFKHPLWSLQGQAGWHVPGGASGRCGGKFLFQLQAKQGCLVSCTPPFYFPFFIGGNRYASTLLTLNICYLLLGQLVESSGLYPRNWLFDHRLISVGKHHFGNDSVLQPPQQSHFSSWGTHFEEPDGACAAAEPRVLSHPRRLAPNTFFSSGENIYVHLFSTIPNISLGLHQWGDGSTYIISHKLKIRDLRHRDI